MGLVNVKGKIVKDGMAFIKNDNHSYRYGDGLFETMKVRNESILLSDLHFERLFTSLSVLKYRFPGSFTRQNLEKEIIDLCNKNKCGQLGRVRLSVSRGNGGLYDVDENFHWIIECWPLTEAVNKFNENGLVIDVFADARKTCDLFSNLKSASHLSYVMAALYATENTLNDCVLLNTYGRICDSTIANIFWVKDQNIFTPPLSEGCINGVMRRHLIQSLQGTTVKVQEKPCQLDDLENADEVFLTNAIQGIKWVKQFRSKTYAHDVTRDAWRITQKLIE